MRALGLCAPRSQPAQAQRSLCALDLTPCSLLLRRRCVDEGRNPDAHFVAAVLDTSAANQARACVARKHPSCCALTRSLAHVPSQATKGRVQSLRALSDALVAEAVEWQAGASGDAPSKAHP